MKTWAQLRIAISLEALFRMSGGYSWDGRQQMMIMRRQFAGRSDVWERIRKNNA